MIRVAAMVLSVLVAGVTPVLASESDDPTYEPVSTGTRVLSSGELAIKVLVEADNLGSSDVEVGEITFPADHRSAGHSHGAIEIFYVVSGRMNHVVNGTAHVLTPGEVGIVRPGDTVVHEALDGAPVRAVVIWAPGGEVERLRRVFPEEALLR
ncbi:MAG: cupin domain-containing protein [Gammaproteobacteria bacterium]|jgi:quercetin dioxygenase-like cupin family protein